MRKNFKDKEEDINILVSKWKKTKDKKILERIIQNHYPMVYNIINQYNINRHFDDGDLLSEGILGILLALDKFDETKNVKFTTYAYFWIKAKVVRFIQKINPLIKNKDIEEDNSSCEENQCSLNEAEADIQQLFKNKSISKVTSMGDLMNAINFEQFIENGTRDEEQNKIDENIQEIVSYSLLFLSQIEREIISRRWLSEKKEKIEVLAKEFNYSEESIRQKEKKAFQKIKDFILDRFGSIRGAILWTLSQLCLFKNY